MTDLRYIRPRAGLVVRDPTPVAARLPDHGKGVRWNSYWDRRLNDGDVIETTEKAVLDAEAAIAKAAAKAAADAEKAPAAETAKTGEGA